MSPSCSRLCRPTRPDLTPEPRLFLRTLPTLTAVQQKQGNCSSAVSLFQCLTALVQRRLITGRQTCSELSWFQRRGGRVTSAYCSGTQIWPRVRSITRWKNKSCSAARPVALTTVESCCVLLQRDDERCGVYDKWTVTQSRGYMIITGHRGETSTIVKKKHRRLHADVAWLLICLWPS